MKFVYNPLENGAPISDWVLNNKVYEHPVGKVIQYEDLVGEALLQTYEFLQDLTSTEAIKLKEELENKKPFPCKYCKDSFDVEIALLGHMRSHKKEIEAETKVDPDIIPVAEGEAVSGYRGAQSMQKPASKQVIDETTGPEFYGPGFQEKHGS